MTDLLFARKLTWGGLFVFSLNKLLGFSLLKRKCCHVKRGCEPFLSLKEKAAALSAACDFCTSIQCDLLCPASQPDVTATGNTWGEEKEQLIFWWLGFVAPCKPLQKECKKPEPRYQETCFAPSCASCWAVPLSRTKFFVLEGSAGCQRWSWHQDVVEALWMLKADVCVCRWRDRKVPKWHRSRGMLLSCQKAGCRCGD